MGKQSSMRRAESKNQSFGRKILGKVMPPRPACGMNSTTELVTIPGLREVRWIGKGCMHDMLQTVRRCKGHKLCLLEPPQHGASFFSGKRLFESQQQSLPWSSLVGWWVGHLPFH